MKQILILVLFIQLSCKSQNDCHAGIELLPMYGEVVKCEEQIQADIEFLNQVDLKYKNRKEASKQFVSIGWECFYKNDLQTSMKRFNQAWLLDNTNPDIYWGFGNILGKKNEFEKSIKYFEKSIKINPNNAKVYQCLSTSLGQMFFKTKKSKYLNQTIYNLKKVIEIEPDNGYAHGQLASAYSYFLQKDSLIKYIKMTDKIDSKYINSEVRKIGTKN